MLVSGFNILIHSNHKGRENVEQNPAGLHIRIHACVKASPNSGHGIVPKLIRFINFTFMRFLCIINLFSQH